MRERKLFLFVDHGKFMALPRRQLRGLDQHMLNVLVALLGNGHAHYFVG
jgi:hypothetical protein